MSNLSEKIKKIIISRDLNITDIANYTGINIGKINCVLSDDEQFNEDELYMLDLRLVKQKCSNIRTNQETLRQIVREI